MQERRRQDLCAGGRGSRRGTRFQDIGRARRRLPINIGVFLCNLQHQFLRQQTLNVLG